MNVVRSFSIMAFALSAVATSSSSSLAQVACAPRRAIVDVLNGRYQEAPVRIGVATPESVLELYVSQTGSWTLLLTGANGRSCVIGSGENWERGPIPAKGRAA